jgi:hypothetical protein
MAASTDQCSPQDTASAAASYAIIAAPGITADTGAAGADRGCSGAVTRTTFGSRTPNSATAGRPSTSGAATAGGAPRGGSARLVNTSDASTTNASSCPGRTVRRPGGGATN